MIKMTLLLGLTLPLFAGCVVETDAPVEEADAAEIAEALAKDNDNVLGHGSNPSVQEDVEENP